jgi:exopolyphosphatase/guanosine-5'-triphosphate,3'-diphosphate pyrophosphatase
VSDLSTPAGPAAGPTVGASVDVGSNSVHLLVAVVSGHRLRPLVDESVLLGLGATLEVGPALGASVRAELVAVLVRYADTARRLGAALPVFAGTDPLRRAADCAEVVAEVERASGIPLHVLTHEEEGLLTLLGATSGRIVRTSTLVVDVGGGSSEFVLAVPGTEPMASGLQIGSARLTAQVVAHDPPTLEEIEKLRRDAAAAVASAPDGEPRELIAVGGTASNLLRVLPAAALDRTLTRRRIGDALAVLATEPAAQASERHAVNLMRARILPAGAAIFEAILDRYGLDRLHVSEEGIREGMVIAAARAGARWREDLRSLALGWR